MPVVVGTVPTKRFWGLGSGVLPTLCSVCTSGPKVEEALTIKDKLPAGGYRMLAYLGVSARWADLYLRRRA